MKKTILIFAAALLCMCMSAPAADAYSQAYSVMEEHVIEIPVVVAPSLSTELSRLEASPAGINE
jgi:uncharacterized protein YcfL